MNKQEAFRLSEYIGLITEVLDSGGEFTLFPRGTSMLPLIVQGRDSVTLIKTESLSLGDIAFYRRTDGSFVLHRIVGEKNGAYIMCGDHQLEREYGITRDMIIGKAIRITRGGREITEKLFTYRLYKILWKNFFIRRICLKIWRTFNEKRLG